MTEEQIQTLKDPRLALKDKKKKQVNRFFDTLK
jgi:hypothetical protein